MPKTIRSQRHERLREILIAARKKACLTQLVLAERLGRPQSFVAKYENGERRLDVVEFVDIVEAIGIAPRKVFARFMAGGTRK